MIIVTAQRNGQPAQSASVAVSVTGPLILGNRCTSATLPTSVLGSALVTGRPGIVVEGTATGTARPVIAADGTFTWVRKTGKKANVYVSDASGGAHHGRCDRARSSARALRTRRVKTIYPRLGTLRVTWCPMRARRRSPQRKDRAGERREPVRFGSKPRDYRPMCICDRLGSMRSGIDGEVVRGQVQAERRTKARSSSSIPMERP